VIGENQLPGSPIVILKCHVPVAESFGLTSTLRAATAGKGEFGLARTHTHHTLSKD
jgi:translation elongation factor EF-G